MTRIVPNPGLGSEFDAFLFAPIGEEGNGMLLSVVSALARLDVDPWQEAAQLARLPAATATRRLTSLFEALPDTAPARQEPATVAARLVGLLPHLAARDESAFPLPGASAPAKRASMLTWAIVMMLILSAQWIAASHLPPARGAKAPAPISSTVTPELQLRT